MSNLPIPDFYYPEKVENVYKVPYEQRQKQAQNWAKEHKIQSSTDDEFGTLLLLIDVQNTFCIPDYELFVSGAVKDNQRLCSFIYRNLSEITDITCTMDTHHCMQIFFSTFWADENNERPEPMQIITLEDVENGKWQVNPYLAPQADLAWLQDYATYYVRFLTEQGKYPLTIWPYHAMIGGIGHSVVSAVHEACFFHSIARLTKTNYEMKGDNPFTENYSVLKPEVMTTQNGEPIAKENEEVLENILTYDRIIIAGQAKSHCVAWTVSDLCDIIQEMDIKAAQKIYLVEDLTSPVIVPGVVDYTEAADSAFTRFADSGMNIVTSTDDISEWIPV